MTSQQRHSDLSCLDATTPRHALQTVCIRRQLSSHNRCRSHCSKFALSSLRCPPYVRNNRSKGKNMTYFPTSHIHLRNIEHDFVVSCKAGYAANRKAVVMQAMADQQQLQGGQVGPAGLVHLQVCPCCLPSLLFSCMPLYAEPCPACSPAYTCIGSWQSGKQKLATPAANVVPVHKPVSACTSHFGVCHSPWNGL